MFDARTMLNFIFFAKKKSLAKNRLVMASGSMWPTKENMRTSYGLLRSTTYIIISVHYYYELLCFAFIMSKVTNKNALVFNKHYLSGN